MIVIVIETKLGPEITKWQSVYNAATIIKFSLGLITGYVEQNDPIYRQVPLTELSDMCGFGLHAVVSVRVPLYVCVHVCAGLCMCARGGGTMCDHLSKM